ncbi:sensor histidine kinase [Sporolactobacillus sp. Y61]|jgi:two-component system LytT family sensor kinase|uniref:Sensor histidine kinase n=1 Tax=Sporolactobacillus sp. Y61 TaxID=3160863 RepID=A0AAU8IF35_9BACL|nr:sensor histidine kinase [Sporolactobacillus sp. THM19-2]RYL94431.1 sensor histidine kinase [Sporolactobacillus sp. THM19-2]
MLIRLFERAALLLIFLFLLTRIPRFKEIFQQESHSRFEMMVITAIFTAFAVFSSYSGIPVDGSLVNTRIITIVSSGILFGPIPGITTGLISGLHRYLIDIDGVTALPCFITSSVAGIVSGLIHNKVKKSMRWIYGIATGMFCEILTMVLILLMTSPGVGSGIVSQIAFPMIMGELNIGLIVLLIQSIEGEKERIASRQAKLSLDIANETLPYFRKINSESLKQICTIIKDKIHADATAMTDTEHVLAYVGFGKERYPIGGHVVSEITKQAIRSGKITVSHLEKEHHIPGIQDVLIIPLKENGSVIGTLKIYYKKAYVMSHATQTMAIGLSQIISTLVEISRLEQMKEAANKAELKALQTSINPHFLFNALNTIASLIRRKPDQARELIITLANYMRYNLDHTEELIDIKKEIGQVRDYVAIEKARFGDRLNINYEVDDVNVRIPCLILQPLVENAIKHGVLKSGKPGRVTISVKDLADSIRISVEDTGTGIDPKVVENLYHDELPEKKIGLKNVHQRVKLVFGNGLVIRRLSPGTQVYFDIRKV